MESTSHLRVSDAPPRAQLGWRDWIAVLALVFAGLIPVLVAYRASDAPKEDALMLLRYSEHLAQGHGITWNIGEKPVEGATDFLFMVMVSGVSKVTGLNVIQSARVLIGASWTALPLLVFLVTRVTLGGNFWFCVALSLYLSAGPGAKYVESCFGAPVAALAAGVTWWLANELIYRGTTWPKALGMGLSAVILGLVRPEGCLLGWFILLAVLIGRPRQAGRIAFVFFSCFGTVGLAYFLWRWHYFGYLWPNPFYVKGGGHLHIDGLKRSLGNMARMLWPAIPIGILGLRVRASRSNLVVLLVPVALFTGIWILLSNENNHLMRFQFPLVPIVLMSLPSLTWGLPGQLGLPELHTLPRGLRVSLAASAVSCLLACMFIWGQVYGPAVDVASGVAYSTELRKFAAKGYTMAVTEAGQFPFYSKWTAIDALGLNDVHIAHYGISEVYLDRYKPELLLYHVSDLGSYKDFDAALHEAGQPIGPLKEDRAARVMHQYALHHGYVLAAAYGDSVCNLHFFWVKAGTADTDEIVSYIRDTPYYFMDSGLLSADYRNDLPHYPCTMN